MSASWLNLDSHDDLNRPHRRDGRSIAALPEIGDDARPVSSTLPVSRMIYMVSCRFTEAGDAARLAQWHDACEGEKLNALLSLEGFHSSQWFQCVHETTSPYIALHNAQGGAVCNEAYLAKGGARFGAWGNSVDDCSRDLFRGLDKMPAVASNDYLVLTDDEATADALTGIDFAWLEAAGLDRSVEKRALAIIGHEDGDDLAAFRPGALRLYKPLQPQRPQATGRVV